MARPKYFARINLIPAHTTPPPGEAAVPIRHFERAANDALNMISYFESHINKFNIYEVSYQSHFHRLHALALLSLVGAFERYLKELAAVCIDHIAPRVFDDRLDVFENLKGNAFASHFAAGSIGRSLCEASTWVNCRQVNDRFRSILADPFENGQFYIFPSSKGQKPQTLQDRYDLMSLIWQIRHTIIHNGGYITRSDAKKFELLTKSAVMPDQVLWPSRRDVRDVKQFLVETADLINGEVAARLGSLLTTIHAENGSVVDPETIAQEIANQLQTSITLAGIVRAPTG